jgi:hypothetical protein
MYLINTEAAGWSHTPQGLINKPNIVLDVACLDRSLSYQKAVALKYGQEKKSNMWHNLECITIPSRHENDGECIASFGPFWKLVFFLDNTLCEDQVQVMTSSDEMSQALPKQVIRQLHKFIC